MEDMDEGKKFECKDDDFEVSSRDEEEVMRIAKMHIKEKHGMEPSDEEVKAKIDRG